ncbi:MAG: hypothetical protein ACI9YH_002582 [Colwellia sp.]|jgi:hypothetical protein
MGNVQKRLDILLHSYTVKLPVMAIWLTFSSFEIALLLEAKTKITVSEGHNTKVAN